MGLSLDLRSKGEEGKKDGLDTEYHVGRCFALKIRGTVAKRGQVLLIGEKRFSWSILHPSAA